jgi:hypothetical protein
MFNVWLTAKARGLAPGGGLQQPQPLADRPLGLLVASPLEIDTETGPLIRVDGLQLRPAEFAVGRRLRCQKRGIRPANSVFRHFGADGREPILCRFGHRCRRARAEHKEQQGGCKAPRNRRWMIGHRRVGASTCLRRVTLGPPTKRADHDRTSLKQKLRIKVNANLPPQSVRAIRARAKTTDRRQDKRQDESRDKSRGQVEWS